MFIIIKLLYQILNNKYCNRHEVERQTVEELRNNISLLEHEKREKAVDRLRYEKEIELLGKATVGPLGCSQRPLLTVGPLVLGL